MKNPQVAISVVVIPDEQMTQRCIAVNEELAGNRDDYNMSDSCLPHITLAMCCIRYDDIEKAWELLQESFQNIDSLSFTANELKTWAATTAFFLLYSEKLQFMHAKSVDILKKFKQWSADVSMFYDSANMDKRTCDGVDSYIPNHEDTKQKFIWHVSVWFWEPKSIELPINFQANRVAICHVWKYCTCRKVLWDMLL